MCCTDYVACVCAAIWSIVQTLFHLAWCVWGTYLYECSYELNSETFKYFWYLTYFYTNSCINATLDNLLYNGPSNYVITSTNPLKSYTNQKNQTLDMYKPDLDIVAKATTSTLVFPPESAVAQRTYNIFQAFIVIDSLWIIAAVALLIGTCYRIRENWAIVFFFPWTAVLLFILFFDGIAAGWYGIDISYTYSLSGWFSFIGGRNQTGLHQIDAKFPKAFTTLPSVVMMIFFSRFFIVWFINLFLFFRVVQAAVNAVENFDDEEYPESKHSNQGSLEDEDVNNQRPRNFQVRDINPNTASARIRRWQLYYGTDDDEEEEVNQTVRRYPRRSSNRKQHTGKEEWHKNNACQFKNAAESRHNLTVTGGYEGDRSTSPSPLPNCDRKQIRNPYNNLYSSGCESNDIYLSYDERHCSSPSISSDYAEIYEDQRTRQPYVGELRGQLPWSYFQDRNDLLVPKGRTYNDTMPPVPVPDYTLKFNDKDIKRVNVF